ncbi:MAG: hypothetical protein M1496_07265 [Candidatus Thermoplasmatota archaeon]|nr:hypothetical protein [Candidatus Thermoplasmatota archaeon]
MKEKYGLNSAAKGNQDSGRKGLYAFICILFRMTIHSIGKTRESLNWSSENYKEAIREYLDTEGYSQISDSFIEGNLADMVFINPSLSVGEKTLVESKATSISSADEKLALEVVKYLVEWLKLDPQERFKFFIFTKSVTKKVEFKKHYGSDCGKKSVQSLISIAKEKLDESSQEIIETADFKDVFNFFRKIEIWEATYEVLKAAAASKRKYSKLSLEGYAKNLITEVTRRAQPIQKKTTLISNLVELTPPTVYYGLRLKFSDSKSIYRHYNEMGKQIPPFLLGKDDLIYTFHDLKTENPFSDTAKGEPIEIELDEAENRQFIVWLINQHLRRLFYLKGIRRAPDSNIFFFEPLKDESGELEKRVCINQHGKEKEVTIPYYKGEEGQEKTLNFVFHHAIEASAKMYWDRWFLELRPRKEYSSDGIHLYEGDTKSAIDNKFRNPIFNRSSNRLSSIRFWRYYLLESEFDGAENEKWFRNFSFGELWETTFGWKPEIPPSNQALLEEYGEEEDDE